MNNIEIIQQVNEIVTKFGGKMVLLLGLSILVELILNDKFAGNKTVKVVCSIAAPVILAVILFASEASLIQETFNVANTVIEDLID